MEIGSCKENIEVTTFTSREFPPDFAQVDFAQVVIISRSQQWRNITALRISFGINLRFKIQTFNFIVFIQQF